MCFPSHLHFESKRIVNLNGRNPADFAVPTTCFAVGFIDSRFDLVHTHNSFTRIVGGNLMSPTIDAMELQNVRVSAPVISTLTLRNSALVSHVHRSDEFFLICRDGG